jgi:hypothetical protein
LEAPSYATARESKDVIKAARQSITKLFWEQERYNYELVVSQYVIDECRLGDLGAAQKRLDFLSGIPRVKHRCIDENTFTPD